MRVLIGMLGLSTCLAAAIPIAAQLAPQTSRDRALAEGFAWSSPDPRGPGDWRGFAAYDFDRLEPGQRRYLADRYYRDWRYYDPAPLSRADRVYRGGNGAYYCRRDDGTTGRVSDNPARRALGNALLAGESAPLGTISAAPQRATLARLLDRQRVVCH